ncbi:MAG: 4-hydroxy-tetrahydrodipicolinate reductase, partial [Candidatus Aenigmarchaeota archaeon]|nr:4-hydroxy-tetrahydrodipicolinate reductase [Candidatus Aenigmarchaeota archaeon]
MTSKIAIIGYGKMGCEIEKAAKDRNIAVQAIIDPAQEKRGKFFTEISAESMKDVDVCIDFTAPAVVMENVKKIAEYKKNIVIGTTGWYDKIGEVREIAEKNNVGIIYAPNFSIGVNLFFRVIENASKLFNRFAEYDPFVYELHHNQKLDSPSGTGKKLGEIVLQNINRKSKAEYGMLDRKIEPGELHVASVRAGSIPGTHVVGFDSKADTIELKHTARGRAGFAVGAVSAAEWIADKKGFYSMDDMMKNILES